MTKSKLFMLFLLQSVSIYAQEVNWSSTGKARNLFSVFTGADYSSYCGISYGRQLHAGGKAYVAGTEVSIPFGTDLLDDWRWKTSIQAEIVRHHHFSLSLKPGFVVRRYTSPLAGMLNLGADVSVLYGYQRRGGGAGLLVNYDRSISARIVHRQLRDDYPGVRDGWYRTRSGNLKLGTRLYLTRKYWGAFLTLGKHYAQDLKDNPTFPFFMELAWQLNI